MALSRQKIFMSNDPVKNQHYCRTITLNVTFGAEVLRLVAEINLKATGLELKDHVQNYKAFFDLHDFEYIQKTNDLNVLDFSKLTVILLDTPLNLKNTDREHINKLRHIRNQLCHSVVAELDNDTLFNKSSQHMMRIVESVDKHNGTTYSREIADKINELKMRKQVPAYHISDRIALCNEKFWQMIRRGDNGDALKIRHGLTMFIKTLAANLNARLFLQILEEKEVISTELKSNIDLIYSNEKQIENLVFHVVNEVDDTKILLLCQCLRQTEKCGQALASMIEYNDDGGLTTDNLIDEKIVSILKLSLEPSQSESVSSSDVHMYVEERLGFESEYKLIWKLIHETFGKQEEMKESISGLKWKKGFEISKRYRCSCTKIQKGTEGGEQLQPVNVVPRKFDTPADNLRYKQGSIKTSNGNILDPSREFRHRSTENIPTAIFISTEVVRFAGACMNGRQNGTIYFGIMNNTIIGIPRCECLDQLEHSLRSAIETCFKENAIEAQLCIRPVQYIPVDNYIVIEVDIVPYYLYLREYISPVWFPSKGKQLKQYYTFDTKVTVVEEHDIEKQNKRCSKLYAQREAMEIEIKREIKCQRTQLHDILTGGHTYVTDAFHPIIVSGKISESPNEITIRRQLDIEYALTSAVMIFDFDSSARLQEKVGESNTSFHAMTTNEVSKIRNMGEIESESIPWIYCNGYDKAEKKEDRDPLPFKKWRIKRKAIIEKALQDIRDKYQENCRVIFLVYQDHIDDTPDPMLKIALKFTELFPRECLVIAENRKLLNKWENTFREEIDSDDLPEYITGLDWDSVSDIMKTSFKLNPDIECELPCRTSTYPVSMTKKEKSYFADIDILSGKECISQLESKTEVSIANIKERTQEDFYRGKGISWWNFYFRNHVGERDLLGQFCKDIDKWLSSGKNPVKEIYIHHHPGSGGTTVGKAILWRYSQFSHYSNGKSNSLYRCCTLKKFTSKTMDQLVRFREYKDEVNPKPIIILIDIDSTSVVKEFLRKLRSTAEMHIIPWRLFSLVVIVQRESFEYVESPFLSHVLTHKEKTWFNEKFEELENAYDSKYVDRLIAFNFLKNSFDEEYINTTTERLLKEVTEDETEVLKCLAMIGAFEKQRNHVPKCVFDEILADQSYCKNESRTHSVNTWDLCISPAMALMLVQHGHCVSLISRSLAMAIILRFKISLKTDLHDLVECLFKVLQKSKRKNANTGNIFTAIVASLFKRESHTVRVSNRHIEVNDKEFSDLVQNLAKKKKFESSTDANQRVTNILMKCFDLTSDTMVAQQLVRYYIFIQEFAEAESLLERTIRSLNYKTSYLLDTYGHIHKAHLVALVKEANDEEKMIGDHKATAIIKMAFKAIEKFREGQTNAMKENPRSGKRNTSCFFNEIKTVLYLLESFKHFKSYQDDVNLLIFLNEKTINLDDTSFAGLVKECPQVKQLRKGEEFQAELEEHVRYLRDASHQTELDVVTVQDERMILSLHERMDLFYCDYKNVGKSIFTCPIDLKSLMESLDDSIKEEKVIRRVQIAQTCIEEGNKYTYDDRDFVIYLGYRILQYSSSNLQKICSSEDYKQLLNYSKLLLKRQCDREDAMLFLETFLFFGMLHWPMTNRASYDYDEFCSPKEYKTCIKTWKKQFNKNLKLSTPEQKERHRPKLLFVLGKGQPGNDIVSLDILEKSIQREHKQNRTVKSISRTDEEFWEECTVVAQTASLTGTVDENGSVICHEAVYSQERTRCLNIEIRTEDHSLQNKKVTFVLGFTWKGPVALGVKEIGYIEKPTGDKHPRNVQDRGRHMSAGKSLTTSDSPGHTFSSLNADVSDSRQPRKTLNFALSKPISPEQISFSVSKSNPEYRDPILVEDAEESRILMKKIISSKPEFVVICCVCHLDLVTIHVKEETYVYHFHENKALLVEGHLDHLLENKEINRVLYDIGSISPDLISNHGILMDGSVWDIQIMFENVKLDKKEKKELTPYGYTDTIFQTWSKQNERFSKTLDRNLAILELSKRGQLIGKMYRMCNGKLDERVKGKDMKAQVKKDIFNKAQPNELKAEIDKLRKAKKCMKKHDKQTPKHTAGSQQDAGFSQQKKNKQSTVESQNHEKKVESESGGRISERSGHSFGGARPKVAKNVDTASMPGNIVSQKSLYSQISAQTTDENSEISHASPAGEKLSSSTLETVPSDRNANWNTRQKNAKKTKIEQVGQTSDRPGNSFNGARPETSKTVGLTSNVSPSGNAVSKKSYSQIVAIPAAMKNETSVMPAVCVPAPLPPSEKSTVEGNSAIQGNNQPKKQSKKKKKKGRKGR